MTTEGGGGAKGLSGLTTKIEFFAASLSMLGKCSFDKININFICAKGCHRVLIESGINNNNYFCYSR